MAVFSFLEILDNLSKVGLEHFAFGTSPKSTCVHSRSTYKFLRTFGLYIYENFFHKLLDRVITTNAIPIKKTVLAFEDVAAILKKELKDILV